MYSFCTHTYNNKESVRYTIYNSKNKNNTMPLKGAIVVFFLFFSLPLPFFNSID